MNVLIVSAYSSGKFLASEIRKLGEFNITHISHHKEFNLNAYMGHFSPDSFDENFLYSTLEELDLYLDHLFGDAEKPICVIPGAESGVETANYIASKYELAGNPFGGFGKDKTRNKLIMQKALSSHGLRAIPSLEVTNLESAVNFFKENDFNTLILKPVSSSSSDGVYAANNAEEIKTAFNKIFLQQNIFGDRNDSVLCQKHISGKEFIINTVSSNGNHMVFDIWEGYSDTPNKISSDLYADLLLHSNHVYKELRDFAVEVLNALDIKVGACHLEVRIEEKTNTPYLIEIASRLPGKIHPPSLSSIFGTNIVQQTIRSYLEPENFAIHIPQQTSKHARYVYFSSPISGQILREPFYRSFYEIESLSHLEFKLHKGIMLRKTNRSEGVGRPGFAYLINSCAKRLEKDYHALKHLEHEQYYRCTEMTSEIDP